MSFEVVTDDFINVADKAAALGCSVPKGIALLPRNFDTANDKIDLIHESSAPTVRILWRQANILETPLEKSGERLPQISEKGFIEWVAPTIFVSSIWLSQNPQAMSVALGVVSNYVTDFFKGIPKTPNVKLDIVVEKKNGEYRRIRYKGTADGIKQLPEIIEKAVSDG